MRFSVATTPLLEGIITRSKFNTFFPFYETILRNNMVLFRFFKKSAISGIAIPTSMLPFACTLNLNDTQTLERGYTRARILYNVYACEHPP